MSKPLGIWTRISSELVFRGLNSPYKVGDKIKDEVKDLLGYHRFVDTVTVVAVIAVRVEYSKPIDTLWRILIRQGT